MGWSWGTAITGKHTSEHNVKVNRLVLFAPVWILRKDAIIAPAPQAASAASAGVASLGAYRLVSKGVARGRWLEGVPEDKNAGLIPPGVFDVWIEATWATDPEASQHKPNGAIADALNYSAAGKAPYDPGKITVPTFHYSCQVGFRSAELSGTGVFRRIAERALKAVCQ
jgi:pimeloyl-ACP methyl ester carboxylesterase